MDIDSNAETRINSQEHRENISPKGVANPEEWFSLVHKPVPIKEAMKIKES